MKRLLTIGLGCVLAACSGEPAEPEAREEAASVFTIHAASYPLTYFAERIGGSAVEVEFALPAEVDPEHWSADPETIAQAQSADLLLRHGVGDPAWVDLASLHKDRTVRTTAGSRDRLIELKSVRHQHGPGGAHSHGAWAGTTWLDPTLAAAEAEAVAESLAARLPEQAEAFRARLELLLGDLDELDRSQSRAVDRLGDTPLLYSHPAYDYLQARYGLNGRSVVWEPDEPPSKAQWRALLEILETHPARIMLWEAEPLPATAKRLSGLGIESCIYSTCVHRPEVGDWLGVMKANVRTLDAPRSAR